MCSFRAQSVTQSMLFFSSSFSFSSCGARKTPKNSLECDKFNEYSRFKRALTLRELAHNSVSIELIVIFLRKNSKRHEKHTYIHQAVVVAAAAALPTQMIRYYSSENKHGEMIIKRNGANGAANRSALFSSCSVDGRRTTKFNKRLIGMRCGAGPCGIADKVRKKRNSFNSMFVAAFDRFRFISK